MQRVFSFFLSASYTSCRMHRWEGLRGSMRLWETPNEAHAPHRCIPAPGSACRCNRAHAESLGLPSNPMQPELDGGRARHLCPQRKSHAMSANLFAATFPGSSSCPRLLFTSRGAAACKWTCFHKNNSKRYTGHKDKKRGSGVHFLLTNIRLSNQKHQPSWGPMHICMPGSLEGHGRCAADLRHRSFHNCDGAWAAVVR